VGFVFLDRASPVWKKIQASWFFQQLFKPGIFIKESKNNIVVEGRGTNLTLLEAKVTYGQTLQAGGFHFLKSSFNCRESLENDRTHDTKHIV